MIAWLFWNPNRIAFTLPGIHHPVAWYGILFALGFFLSYQLLFFLMRRWFCLYPFVSGQDFLCERTLGRCQSPLISAIKKRLPSDLKRAVASGRLNGDQRKRLADAVNQWIKKGTEEALPNSNCRSFLFRFVSRYLTEQQRNFFFRRLQLQLELGGALRSLNQQVRLFCDRLSFYVLISIVIGARLGHILFYEQWMRYLAHPMDILKTWEGGLASHGGILGLFLGIGLFYLKYRADYSWLSIRRLFDFLALPALCSATLIRLGNFVNQEILGTATTVSWAIIFGDPIDGSAAIPRHPAQLYEAIFYSLSLCLLFRLLPKTFFRVGALSGIVFGAVFCFRFFIEFFKCKQSYWMETLPVTMGQVLSVPLIICGIWLILAAKKASCEKE
ncbi:MAG: prolipoprotein diacylglyceryl transferase [Chlamydiota bacterium]